MADRAAHGASDLRDLKAVDKRCTLTVTGRINRPPMERLRGTVRLYQKARALAAELGFTLDEASTGGASDGEFLHQPSGVPTLDGLGAVQIEGALMRGTILRLWWSTWAPTNSAAGRGLLAS